MLKPSEVRDRLTEHMFIGEGALGKMETVLSKLIDIDNIKVKVKINNGIEQSIDAALAVLIN